VPRPRNMESCLIRERGVKAARQPNTRSALVAVGDEPSHRSILAVLLPILLPLILQMILIVIQPETSHEYDQLDPTLIITDIPEPQDIVLSKEDMKKTAIIIDDFEMSRLNKVQIANLSKLFRYLSSHNNISIFCGYQDFFSVPIIIRKCCTHFLIWRTRNSDELTIISKRVGISKEIMHEIFRREMKSRRDSLMIDLVSPDPLFIRKNVFEPLNIENYKPLKLAKRRAERQQTKDQDEEE